MKEIGDGNGSKSDPLDRNDDEEGCNENKSKTSASSSNSIAEESEKKLTSNGVRPYMRSKVQRLRWTPDLHLCFLQAVERLGGEERATPKLVLQVMGIKGLSIAHVKSHLQMYRSKKIDNQGQVVNGRGYLTGSADGLSHNFWQPRMLDHKFRSDFRYRNVSWSGHGCWMSRSSTTDNMNIRDGGIGENRRNGAFYVDNSSTITMQNSRRTHDSSQDFRLSNGCESKQQTRSALIEPSFTKQWHGSGGENGNRFNKSILPDTSWRTNGDQRSIALKRKAPDKDLDLNLSLSMKSRQEKVKKTLWDDDEEVDSNLSLSLFIRSKKENSSADLNFASKVSGLKEDSNAKNRRLASTLDLTI